MRKWQPNEELSLNHVSTETKVTLLTMLMLDPDTTTSTLSPNSSPRVRDVPLTYKSMGQFPIVFNETPGFELRGVEI